MPDKETRLAPARPRAAVPARAAKADPGAASQTGALPRNRSGHRSPGPAPAPEERDLAARRLRYAYAVGKLNIGQLADRLADARAAGAGELVRLTKGLPQPPPRPERPGDFHRSYPADLPLLDELGRVGDPLERAVSAAAAADAAAARLETARQHRSLALVTANVRYGVPQIRCYDPYTGVSGRRQFHRAVRQTQANLPEYGPLWSRIQQFAADPAALNAARAELEDDRSRPGEAGTLPARLTVTSDELAAAVAAATASPGLAAQVAWIRDRIPRVDAEVRPGDDPDARLANAKIAIAFADYWHLRYEEARSTAETARLVFGREVRDLTSPANPARVRNAELARRTGLTTARIAQIRTSPVTV